MMNYKSIDKMKLALRKNDTDTINKLILEENWTNSQIRAVKRKNFEEFLEELEKSGEIVPVEELIDMIEGDGFEY